MQHRLQQKFKREYKVANQYLKSTIIREKYLRELIIPKHTNTLQSSLDEL